MDVSAELIGDVFVVDLGDGENRFNLASIAGCNAVLDQIEAVAIGADRRPVAMVTTGSGKYFSNGIDLDWMLNDEPKDVEGFLREMMKLWARVMALPIPTVAVLNGHAFAGGAMFSLTHDHVLMRAERGYWCVNEVLLQLPFAPGMQALFTARLPAPTIRKATLTAHRFDGPAAVAAGIADDAIPGDELLGRAIELAQSLIPTANPILGRLKEDLYADCLAALRQGDVPPPV